MFENMNFEPGKVVYNDFDVNPKVQLESQVDSLKEDLFQVNYSDQYIIDVGWYPEFDEDGSFRICIIKDFNWEAPLFEKRCRDISTLNQLMCECINLINNFIKDK